MLYTKCATIGLFYFLVSALFYRVLIFYIENGISFISALICSLFVFVVLVYFDKNKFRAGSPYIISIPFLVILYFGLSYLHAVKFNEVLFPFYIEAGFQKIEQIKLASISFICICLSIIGAYIQNYLDKKTFYSMSIEKPEGNKATTEASMDNFIVYKLSNLSNLYEVKAISSDFEKYFNEIKAKLNEPDSDPNDYLENSNTITNPKIEEDQKKRDSRITAIKEFFRNKQNEKDWKPYLLIKLFEDSPLDKLFLESMVYGDILMVHMQDKKVYVGLVVQCAEPNESQGLNQEISLLPVWSGYRDNKKMSVVQTSNYFFEVDNEDEILNDYLENESYTIVRTNEITTVIESNPVVLKQSNILSATKFSDPLFDKFGVIGENANGKIVQQ